MINTIISREVGGEGGTQQVLYGGGPPRIPTPSL